MATEKFIHDKVEEGHHHDGRHANLRRLLESDDEVVSFWSIVWQELKDAVLGGKLEDDERTQDDIV